MLIQFIAALFWSTEVDHDSQLTVQGFSSHGNSASVKSGKEKTGTY